MPDGPLFLFDRTRDANVFLRRAGMALPGSSEIEKYRDILECFGAVSRTAGTGETWGRIASGAAVPDEFTAVGRRDLAAILGRRLFLRSGAAFQMMSLCLDNKLCGRCGAAMEDHDKETARVCPGCGRVVFPSLAPAMIVAVERDGMILLGHNASFPSGRYSVLAGFVEPGETVEDAVIREVYEESRVRIKNILYVGSQPWPFPSSMMLGFRAEWESGEPCADGFELTDVRWFTPYDLPDLPQRISISRMLIDDWLRRVSADAPHG
ncbi:MAG: NAD(+) diphosphatase [Synergistaceae bacterium]|nr:NAD(+) diphosphatase [Synergistaceae bacterium]